MTLIDNNKPYVKYAKDVLSGKIAAGKYLKLACQRFIDWFNRPDIWFDYDIVDTKFQFIHEMKHYQGDFAGKNFELMPWETWVLANLWGFKWIEDNTNVINKALITMSRKNAKTALCAAIALCHVIFDERGGECDFLANSAQQAAIALDHTLHFAKSLDPKEKIFKRYRNQIKVPKTDSTIMVQSSDTTSKDGFNSSLFIQDEFGAAKDWELYNLFLSSMGMRRNPLAIVISTAGFLLEGYPMYDYVATCKNILDGKADDDTQFSAIYMLDPEDDWKDETVWIKSNPSLGETVTKKYLKSQVTNAKNQPSTETSTKTKNFNMFCQSANVWLADEDLFKSMKKIDLKDFIGETCYMGVDLSAVSDITATAILFPPNSSRTLYPDKFVFKVLCYLPSACLNKSQNKILYDAWKKNKYLILTSGNVVDYDEILKDQVNIYESMDLTSVAYDSWNATQWAVNATNYGLPLQPYSQALGSFNRPTKEFERLLLQGKLVIDANPIIRWAAANCELKIDLNGNQKPIKAGGVKSKKIDPIIAMLQALGAYLIEGEEID